MNPKIILYTKIFLVLGITFFVTRIAMDKVFIAGTPEISPNFIASFFKQEKKQVPDEKKTDFALKKVSQGVYASSPAKKVEYRLDEIEWVEYTFNINGKEVKITIPKDQEVPSKEILEKMYK